MMNYSAEIISWYYASKFIILSNCAVQPCLATRRLWLSVEAAPRCCASPPGEGLDWLKAAHSGRRANRCTNRDALSYTSFTLRDEVSGLYHCTAGSVLVIAKNGILRLRLSDCLCYWHSVRGFRSSELFGVYLDSHVWTPCALILVILLATNAFAKHCTWLWLLVNSLITGVTCQFPCDMSWCISIRVGFVLSTSLFYNPCGEHDG